MKNLLISITFAVSAAFLISRLGVEKIFAVLAAAAVHELGHLAAIRLLGGHINCIRVEPCGLRLDYSAVNSEYKDIAIAAAGPTTGLLYTWLVSHCSLFFRMTGELSLMYSVFNLLPVMPMDGGRILDSAANRLLGDDGRSFVRQFSKILSVALSALGLYFAVRGEGTALFAAGIWILLMQG